MLAVENFPSLALGPQAATPTRSGRLVPLEEASAGTKTPLSASRPSCSFSQMSSCLHPTGPVPQGADRPPRLPPPAPVPRDPRGLAGLTAQEAGLVEAAAFALDLLGEVHGLLAYPASLASSPVRHSETGHGNGNSFTGPRGRRRTGQVTAGRARGAEAPAGRAAANQPRRSRNQGSEDAGPGRGPRPAAGLLSGTSTRGLPRGQWGPGLPAAETWVPRGVRPGQRGCWDLPGCGHTHCPRPKALSLHWAPEGSPRPRGRARGNGHLVLANHPGAQPRRVAWT